MRRDERVRAEREEDVTKQKSFEDDLERLEALVAKLERGELGLEESLKAFEEGTRLAESLSKRLDEAQGRIMKLTASRAGEPVLEEFESGDEN